MAKTIFNPRDDFLTSVALGLVDGIKGGANYAKTIDALTADTEVIIGRSSATPVWPSNSGTTMEIYNSDAATTGAVIDIMALDVNFEEVNLQVNVTGAGSFPLVDDNDNPVTLTRINSAVNRGTRSTGLIATDLDIRDISTPTLIYGRVLALSQEMQQAMYTVPSDKYMIILDVFASLTKSTGTDVGVQCILKGAGIDNVFRRFFTYGVQRTGASGVLYSNNDHTKILGGVDLYTTVIAGASGAEVSNRMSFILVDK